MGIFKCVLYVYACASICIKRVSVKDIIMLPFVLCERKEESYVDIMKDRGRVFIGGKDPNEWQLSFQNSSFEIFFKMKIRKKEKKFFKIKIFIWSVMNEMKKILIKSRCRL